VIGLPPLLASVKEIVALPSPGTAEVIVGAPGTVAVIRKLCRTCGAGLKFVFPAWSAATVQVPAVSIVTLAPDTEQTELVVELKVTASPEVAVAERLIGVVLNV
jgi:hypothetical protein